MTPWVWWRNTTTDGTGCPIPARSDAFASGHASHALVFSAVSGALQFALCLIVTLLQLRIVAGFIFFGLCALIVRIFNGEGPGPLFHLLCQVLAAFLAADFALIAVP